MSLPFKRTYMYDDKLGRVIEVTGQDFSRQGTMVLNRVDIKSFVTDNISGKPMEVRSRRHEKQLMKKHGLTQAPGYKEASARNKEGLKRVSKVDKNFKWSKPKRSS